MKKRQQTKSPGKKRGATIKNPYALRPFGIKTNGFEFPVRAALLALDAGVVSDDHLVMLWTLADLAQRIGGEDYIQAHVQTLKCMCYALEHATICTPLQYVAVETSANLLVNWVHQQKNVDIATQAVQAIAEIEGAR